MIRSLILVFLLDCTETSSRSSKFICLRHKIITRLIKSMEVKCREKTHESLPSGKHSHYNGLPSHRPDVGPEFVRSSVTPDGRHCPSPTDCLGFLTRVWLENVGWRKVYFHCPQLPRVPKTPWKTFVWVFSNKPLWTISPLPCLKTLYIPLYNTFNSPKRVTYTKFTVYTESKTHLKQKSN